MGSFDDFVLVFGATGQQGGAVARALLSEGRNVRAFVRDADSPAAQRLRASGAQVRSGSILHADDVRAAAAGASAIYSTQPSSGQAGVSITDEEEVAAGTLVVDAAQRAGTSHLVYSSSTVLSAAPTGVAHFDTKARIEDAVRASDLPFTIVRPTTFMEMLPDAAPDGVVSFLMAPDTPMQFISAADIGVLVARIMADAQDYRGVTVDLAADELTGHQVAAELSHVLGTEVRYRRMDLEGDILPAVADLIERGPLRGDADIPALRALHPALQTYRDWLALRGADDRAGRPAARI